MRTAFTRPAAPVLLVAMLVAVFAWSQLLGTSASFAQGPPRSDSPGRPEGSPDEGGYGRPGAYGGPGGYGGGPPSPDEVVGRMDANRNGTIEPEEMQGRMGSFIERAVREAGVDTSKPFPVDKLREIMRRRFSRGPDSPEGDSDRGGRPDEGRWSKVDPVPKAPGFGSNEQLALVPGFEVPLGSPTPAQLSAKYSEDILRRVADTLRRYDRNGNGVLEHEEWKDGRWSTDPRSTDTNKDGSLTREELAQRYLAYEKSSSSSVQASQSQYYYSSSYGSPYTPAGPSSSSSNSSSAKTKPSSSTSSSSSSMSSRYVSYAEGMLKQYDTDKDGVLTKDEWGRLRKEHQGADKNSDGKISKQELAEQLASYSQGSSSSSSAESKKPRGSLFARALSVRRKPKDSSSSDSNRNAERSSYRFLSPAERLPDNVPDWFADKDADGDGQVAMSEYTSDWSDSKAAEFSRYDLNGDGMITAAESVAADGNSSARTDSRGRNLR